MFIFYIIIIVVVVSVIRSQSNYISSPLFVLTFFHKCFYIEVIIIIIIYRIYVAK